MHYDDTLSCRLIIACRRPELILVTSLYINTSILIYMKAVLLRTCTWLTFFVGVLYINIYVLSIIIDRLGVSLGVYRGPQKCPEAQRAHVAGFCWLRGVNLMNRRHGDEVTCTSGNMDRGAQNLYSGSPKSESPKK